MTRSEHPPYIILATRNGAHFLEQQIASLSAQSHTDWRLLARDDGSTDETCALLDAWAARDSRIERLPSGSEGGSAMANFAVLFQAALERGAEYLFCCDQDDVWRPDKLERMLDALLECEGPERVPSLVHHDLEVVDECLNTAAKSYWRHMALTPGDERLPGRLLSRNEVTGCAMACNRALLQRALPIPPQAIMHDWWLALHAAFLGRLRALPEPLVRYRQHGANVVGARSFLAGLNPFSDWRARWRTGNDEFLATARQAAAFADALAAGGQADEMQRAAVRDYALLPMLSRGARLSALRRVGAWRSNLLLDAVLVARMMFLARQAGL